MPRGFLVKRFKQSSTFSYRERRVIEDDRSDSGSEQDFNYSGFGSPDSGYSASPTTNIFRDKEFHATDKDNNNIISTSLPFTSSVNINLLQQCPSPVYYTAFDRLNLSGDSPFRKTGVQSENKLPLPIPTSPNRKRPGETEKRNIICKRSKAIRRINFDLDTTSPVSGTIIKEFSDGEEGRVVCGDIEPSFNLVEVTPEARAELEKIENKIGDYICQLCKEFHEDAFQLAQHRCSRIVHVEYRCPECDKVFNCPANLASHRRWHKPKPNGTKSPIPSRILPGSETKSDSYLGQKINFELNDNHVSLNASAIDLRTTQNEDGHFECETCGKKFKRQAYLKKHVLTHVNDVSSACQYCGKIFFNETVRTKHESQHSISNTEFMCKVCDLSFPSKGTLDKHSRMHNKNNFPCRFCPSSFYSSPGLTRHINKCHPSENRQVILLQIPVSRPC
ncbi:insulinoma-associated protein 1a [Patella vulgata]|uniref:insulinoma-associated protein 1a n=1 Tax=Patella vulgata TaxID=6465 RepID=UPI0021805316|nr:insulinoma-associated protein 1a [Patella vulgata]